MLEKIMAKLRAKYPGLSKKLLELVGAKLATTVGTDETKIDDAITALDNSPIKIEDFAGYTQSEADRRVTEARRQWEADSKGGDDDDDDDQGQNDKRDKKDPNAALLATINKLSEKIDKLESGNRQQSLRDKLKAKLDAKKIPERYMRGLVVEKEEDLESVFTQVESDYQADQDALVAEGWAKTTKPEGGEGASGILGKKDVNAKKAEADILNWTKVNNPQKEAQKA